MTGRIAIIGGGWAGLAAAVRLVQAGQHVTLFEASKTFGGRARTLNHPNTPSLDNGQHILLGAYHTCLDLIKTVGVCPERLLERRPLAFMNDVGFHLALSGYLPAPLNLATGLFRLKSIPWQEKVKTALWMNHLKASCFQIPQDISVSHWLAKSPQSAEIIESLWKPLCLAAMNTHPDKASAQVFANILRDSLGSSRRSDTDLLIPKAPLGALFPEPAIQWLQKQGADIRPQTRIKELGIKGPFSFQVNTESFCQVIVACAPQHAVHIHPLLSVDLNYAPIATAYLQYPTEVRLPSRLFHLTAGTSKPWVVDRGNGLIACVFSDHGCWERLNNTELVHAMDSKLGLKHPLLWHKVIREHRATFSATPNLIRPEPYVAPLGIWRIGDYCYSQYPGTLEGAARSGEWVSAQILGSNAFHHLQSRTFG